MTVPVYTLHAGRQPLLVSVTGRRARRAHRQARETAPTCAQPLQTLRTDHAH